MPTVRAVVVQALATAADGKLSAETIAELHAGGDIAFEKLDLTSLKRFEIIMQVEEEFDVEIDDDEVMEQESISALIALIETKRTTG